MLTNNVLVRVVNLHRDEKRKRKPGRYGKFLCDTRFDAQRVLLNIPVVNV